MELNPPTVANPSKLTICHALHKSCQLADRRRSAESAPLLCRLHAENSRSD
jgi:hypothetical protein